MAHSTGPGLSSMTSTVSPVLVWADLALLWSGLRTPIRVRGGGGGGRLLSCDVTWLHSLYLFPLAVRWPTAYACPVQTAVGSCKVPTFDGTWNVSVHTLGLMKRDHIGLVRCNERHNLQLVYSIEYLELELSPRSPSPPPPPPPPPPA